MKKNGEQTEHKKKKSIWTEYGAWIILLGVMLAVASLIYCLCVFAGAYAGLIGIGVVLLFGIAVICWLAFKKNDSGKNRPSRYFWDETTNTYRTQEDMESKEQFPLEEDAREVLTEKVTCEKCGESFDAGIGHEGNHIVFCPNCRQYHSYHREQPSICVPCDIFLGREIIGGITEAEPAKSSAEDTFVLYSKQFAYREVIKDRYPYDSLYEKAAKAMGRVLKFKE